MIKVSSRRQTSYFKKFCLILSIKLFQSFPPVALWCDCWKLAVDFISRDVIDDLKIVYISAAQD
jgi:hypothetical protein